MFLLKMWHMNLPATIMHTNFSDKQDTYKLPSKSMAHENNKNNTQKISH